MKTLVNDLDINAKIYALKQTKECAALGLNFMIRCFGLIRFAKTLEEAEELYEELLDGIISGELTAAECLEEDMRFNEYHAA